jgi:serine/threonine-protein kinase
MTESDDRLRVQTLHETGLLDSPEDPEFDRITRLAAKLLRCPVALVSLVGTDRQFLRSAVGLAEPWASRWEAPLSHSFCRHAVREGSPLVTNDARADERFRDSPAIAELGVVAYLGLPLFARGQPLGALCVLDHQPRQWGDDDIATMSELAHAAERLIELRRTSAALTRMRTYQERLLADLEELARTKRALEEKVGQLREPSSTDELTGLLNRRGFVSLAAKQLQIANRNGKRLVVLFAEVDGLEELNDRRGHEAGDAVLIAVAGVLRRTFREADIIGRLGGNEFAVLATDAPPDEAPALVARLQGGAREVGPGADTAVQWSMSVGTAIYDPAQPRTMEAVLSEADAAMYRAKRRRVEHGRPLQVKVCPACHAPERGGRLSCGACSASLDAVPDATVVDGQYVVVGELGRGGMGVVYLAYDLDLERTLAVKVQASRDGEPPSLEVARRFRREAAALGAVRSPHVVQVFAFGSHEGSPFIAMEHVAGVSLEEIVSEHRRHRAHVPVARAIAVMRQVAEGLDCVHAAGLVHRDVKPANVVIEDGSGRPVLIDFGIADRVRQEEDPVGWVAAGTAEYMAPELLLGPPSVRSDVYALGCVAFELLTGVLPFDGGDVRELLLKHRLEAPRPPSSLRPGLEPFDGVLARALAKDPADRPSSCGALAAQLEDAMRTWESPEPTVPPEPSARAETLFESAGAAPADDVLDVLVVDDDETCRRLAARCAQVAFYKLPIRVRVAASGVDALACAREHMPRLVILDYAMPGLDGVETLTQIRNLPGGDRARVLAVSANMGRSERWRFSVLGVTDFADKPLALPAFVQLIGSIADRAGWRHALETRETG